MPRLDVPDEAAHLTLEQLDLYEAMSEISERLYNEAWVPWLEKLLWRAVVNGPIEQHGLAITAEDVKRLRTLSERCSGWLWRSRPQYAEWVPQSAWVLFFALGEDLAAALPVEIQQAVVPL